MGTIMSCPFLGKREAWMQYVNPCKATQTATKDGIISHNTVCTETEQKADFHDCPIYRQYHIGEVF